MLVDYGHTDDGNGVVIRARTNPVAPEGAAMECSFDRVYVTITRSAALDLLCTPVVDETLLPDSAFAIKLDQPTTDRSPYTHEQVLRTPREGGAYFSGLRGRWFALQIDSAAGVFAGDLILDQVDLEYSRVSPTERT